MRNFTLSIALICFCALAAGAQQPAPFSGPYTGVPTERFLAMAITKVDPVYPPDALKAGSSGPVRLYVYVNLDGTVAQVTVSSGEPVLAEAAKAALSQWMFPPGAANNGKPMPMGSPVFVVFGADGKVSIVGPSTELYRAILKVHPEDYNTELGLAADLAKQGDVDGAIVEYQAAVTYHPDKSQLYMDLGRLYFKKEDWQRAADEFKMYLPLIAGDDHGTQLELAQALMNAGAWDEAYANFKQILQKYPKRPDTLMFYGEALYHKGGNPEQAEAAFREALNGRADAATQHGILCGRLVESGNSDGAIVQCKEGLEPPQGLEHATNDSPSAAMTHHYYGVALERKGSTQAALEQYQAASQMMPNVAAYQNDLRRLGSFVIDPFLPPVSTGVAASHEPTPELKSLLDAAASAQKSNDNQKSYDLARQALKIDADSESANWLAGGAAFNLRHYPESISYYKKHLELAPNNWRARIQLIRTYEMAGMKTERDAERDALRDIRRKGTDPELNSFQNYLMDEFYVGEKQVRVLAFFELTGRFGYRYYFDVFNTATKQQEYRIALESDEMDQPIFANEHPAEAAAGSRRFSMDTYQQNSHGLMRFFDGEPSYDDAKALVTQAVQGKVTPQAATTVHTKQ